MKKYILLVLIYSLVIVSSAIAQNDKILVIVNSQIYFGLQAEIDRYVDDISIEYDVSLYETNGGTAQDLKDFITSHSNNLAGCIFIGSMPVFWFKIENDEAAHQTTYFPCDLFFMDLDGLWTDDNNDGLIDNHTDGTGDITPEIFIGRIDASSISFGGDTEIENLRKYFNRDHNYWTGVFSFRKTGLTYTDTDWQATSDINEGMRNLYGYNNYQLIQDKRVGGKDYLENRLCNDQYEFCQVAVHSTYYYHFFSKTCEEIYSEDILRVSHKALGYNLFACSACDYTHNNFLGGTYIFNDSEKSLVVVGSTKAGSMLQFYAFYQPLGENKSIGQAFKEWFEYVAPYQKIQKAWHYGMTILGDPLIRFNNGGNNHGPLVDIGGNQRILLSDSVVELNSIVKDDGFPEDSPIAYNWEILNGPGIASFEDSHSPITTIHLDTLGDYRIRLSVSDGEFSSEDYKDIKISRIRWEGETDRPANGITMGLIVRDSLAYFTTTRDLIIMNIKNKSNPLLVSSFEFEKQNNVYHRCKLAVDSDYAYIASGQKGLYIIDISDHYNPQQVGFYSSNDPNECINDVKVIANNAYLTDSIRGLIILDIHDRSNPTLLGYCPTNGTAEALSIQGNYAFIADGNNGLRIMNISNKRIPKEIGSYNNSFRSFGDNELKQNIQVSGNYVYISYEHPSKTRCISIIDISDKMNSIEVACFETWYDGFYVKGNYLYFIGYFGSGDYDVFGIVDITDKLYPKVIETFRNDELYFQGNISIYEADKFVYIGGTYLGRGINIFQLHLDNTSPYVWAGEDSKLCNKSILLEGIVSDDNLPTSSSLTFLWEKTSGPGEVLIAEPTALNTEVNISNNGEYIFRLSASDGELTGFDDVKVNYFSAPPNADNAVVCEKSQVHDFIVTGENIRWYGDAELINLLYEGNTFATGQTTPGIYNYYVTQTLNNCESLPDTVTLSIISTPIPPLAQDATFCLENKDLELNATGEDIKWYSDTDLTSLVGLGNSFKPVQSLPGRYIYYLTQTIAACESDAGTVTLTINPLPIIRLGEDTTLYTDQNLMLGPFTDDFDYFWSDGSENPYCEISGRNLGLGDHQIVVMVNDTNNCNTSDTISIHVIAYSDIHNDQNNSLIRLFPNPTTGSITIDLNKAFSDINIEITELDGRMLQMEKYDNARVINLQLNAEPGIYLVTLTTINDRMVFRIIRN